MLILGKTRGERDSRPYFSNNARKFDGVSGSDFKMAIAIELNKLDRRSQHGSRSFRFVGALPGCTVRPGLTARANNKMDFARCPTFKGDYTSATEFNIVRVRTKGEEWR
jgi:hypothetical protein